MTRNHFLRPAGVERVNGNESFSISNGVSFLSDIANSRIAFGVEGSRVALSQKPTVGGALWVNEPLSVGSAGYDRERSPLNFTRHQLAADNRTCYQRHLLLVIGDYSTRVFVFPPINLTSPIRKCSLNMYMHNLMLYQNYAIYLITRTF